MKKKGKEIDQAQKPSQFDTPIPGPVDLPNDRPNGVVSVTLSLDR